MATKIETGLGYSPLTDNVYWGRQNSAKGMWVGEKKDVTNNFISVMFAYLEVNKIRTITEGKNSHLFIHIDKSEEKIKSLIKNLQKMLDKKSKP